MGLLSLFNRTKEDVPVVIDQMGVIRQMELEEMRVSDALDEMDANGDYTMRDRVHARLLKYPDGYGYEVCVGGTPVVSQRYNPELEGNVPMTEADARLMALQAARKYEVV